MGAWLQSSTYPMPEEADVNNYLPDRKHYPHVGVQCKMGTIEESAENVEQSEVDGDRGWEELRWWRPSRPRDVFGHRDWIAGIPQMVAPA